MFEWLLLYCWLNYYNFQNNFINYRNSCEKNGVYLGNTMFKPWHFKVSIATLEKKTDAYVQGWGCGQMWQCRIVYATLYLQNKWAGNYTVYTTLWSTRSSLISVCHCLSQTVLCAVVTTLYWGTQSMQSNYKNTFEKNQLLQLQRKWARVFVTFSETF